MTAAGAHAGAGTCEQWRDVRRVLAVRLDALGDVLMTTPALHAIRSSASGARVTLLTSPGGADAARLTPDVDEVIDYDAPWMKATARRASSEPDRDLIERLRGERFDAAVVFTVYSQNPLPAALLCFLAEIPRRLAHCRENPYQLLTHWVPECERS
jgi:ADP-heptose:LPS heptosyltransferase